MPLRLTAGIGADSHVVKLEDGSRSQIFPGDVDSTLDWLPETDLTLAPAGDGRLRKICFQAI